MKNDTSNTPKERQVRSLAWDACYNVRELGGYATENGEQIRWQALIRADNINRLTPEGQAALRDYGIRTIIDLRTLEELETHPNPYAVRDGHSDRPRYLHLPLHDSDSEPEIEAAETIRDLYVVIIERNKALVAAVVKAVAASLEDGAVLVHCHGGKDRTGIVVAFLLTLAGVPRDVIAQDYALSQELLEPGNLAWLEEQAQAQGHPVERPRWMFSRPETMRGFLDYLDQQYGGVEGYLEAIGVTRAEIARIREWLVTSS